MKGTVFFTAILYILIILSSTKCSTSRSVIAPKEQESFSSEAEDIRLSINFLNEEALTREFGKTNNPFLAPPSALGSNRFLVFEIAVENNAAGPPVVVELNRIELQFGGRYKNPTNQFHLSSFWETRIEKYERYRGWSSGKVNQIIKRTVLPNTLIVEPQSGTGRLAVFMGRFPDYGPATLYIPVFAGEGKLLENFRFTFQF